MAILIGSFLTGFQQKDLSPLFNHHQENKNGNERTNENSNKKIKKIKWE
jgi:hypothetical protein